MLKRWAVGIRLVFRAQHSKQTKVNATLVRTAASARIWFDDLLTGKATSINALAEREGISKSYACEVIRLAFLAPDIVKSVLARSQPANLVADHLLKANDLPYDWQAQRQLFGFA